MRLSERRPGGFPSPFSPTAVPPLHRHPGEGMREEFKKRDDEYRRRSQPAPRRSK